MDASAEGLAQEIRQFQLQKFSEFLKSLLRGGGLVKVSTPPKNL